MSFAFGFAGDDIEYDDADMLDDPISGKASAKTSQPLIQPKMHILSDLLSDLPSQLSFNYLTIPPSLTIARRSLFDIRQQLMAESSNTNDNEALIANLSAGDLSSGTYEGGFKTWECAIDLASLLSTPDFASFLSSDPTNPDSPIHVIELGAGSAVPSLAVLHQALSLSKATTSPHPPLNLTLCDYNEDVLKLCTAPNIFLNYHLHTQRQNTPSPTSQTDPDADLDLDLDLDSLAISLPQITQAISSTANINISLVSGAWGSNFYSLLKPAILPPPSPLSPSPNPTSPTFPTLTTTVSNPQPSHHPPSLLILASETIYSPLTLPDFVGTLLGLLSLGAVGSSRALVAAKKVYFGVGGGVAEFEREVAGRGGVVRRVWDSGDMDQEKEGDGGGVGRVVLEVVLES